MKYLLKTAGIYLAFAAQNIIFEKIKIFSCSPDLLLAAIVICAVSLPMFRAAALGGFAGLLADALYGHVFGVNIFVYMYFALLVSAAVDEKTSNSPLLMSWVCFVSIAALEIIMTILKAMFGYDASIGFMGASILVKGLFGGVFTLVFVLLVQHFKGRKIKNVISAEEEAV